MQSQRVCFYGGIECVLAAGQAQLGPHRDQSHATPLYPSWSFCHPHFLHRDTTLLYRTVNKTSAPPPPPPSLQWCSSFSLDFLTQQDLRGRAGGRVELPWDYPSLGFWLGLRQNPGELFGLCMCVCAFLSECECTGEGKYGSVHLPLDPKGKQPGRLA